MIEVVDRPLAEVRAEAMIRPVRTDWAAITTDGRQIELAAGEEWAERCAAQGELPLGSAAITDAGELAAEFVIHVAVASQEQPATRRSVRRGLENGLRRAGEWEVVDVASPLLGTGPGALDPEAACRAMTPLLEAWDAAGGGRRMRVCAPDPASRREAAARWGEPGEDGASPTPGAGGSGAGAEGGSEAGSGREAGSDREDTGTG